MVEILIYLSLALIALSLLMMLGFGLRALVAGRKNFIAIGAMVLAIVVFAVVYVAVDAAGYDPLPGNPVTQGEAAIVLTAVVMFGLAIVALLGSAIRGIIT